MLLDNRTLAVMFYLTASMTTLALFFNAWSVKKFKGPGLWVAGEMVLCISFYFLSIQGYVNNIIGITLGGSGLVAGLIFFLMGTARFLGKKISIIFYIVPFAIHLLLSIYYTYISFDTVIRIKLLSFFLFWTALFTALIILKNLPQKNRPQYIFTASIFILFALFNLARFTYSFYMDNVPGLYSTGEGLTLAYMVSIITNLSVTIGFLIMTKARFENELLSNLDLLRSALATRDKLFSVVAHDLRGPIGNISAALSFIYSIKETISKEECFRFLEPLKDQSESTFTLLERLLTWSKSQNHEITYNPETLNLKGIVDDELSRLYPYVNRKGIKIELNIEDDFTLLADESLLSIVMRNLISNAVKFTYPSGRIEIGTAPDIPGRMKGFYVKDSGMGMDSDEITSILEGRPDKIGGNFGTEGETGTGLGLMLCREFVQISRGKFLIESEPGTGTTVTVLLPEG